MRFNKKASMELGISTVVVLVIAMVIIAGGIAFIRGFFKLGEKKLGGAFNVGDFGIQPSSVEPLVLVDGPTIGIKAGDTSDVKVGFYNLINEDHEVKIKFDKCEGTAAFPPSCSSFGNVPKIVSLSQKVAAGESAGFKTYVTASCITNAEGTTTVKLLPGEYICNLKAVTTDVTGTTPIDTPLATAQITISVSS